LETSAEGSPGIDDVLPALELSGAVAEPGQSSGAKTARPAGADLERLRADFPPAFPKYTEAPFFF